MRIRFIGKRHYTNRDAYSERFGRIYQLPYWWANAGHEVDLWLIDYHGREAAATKDGGLNVETTPLLRWRFFVRLVAACRFYRRSRRPDVVVASGDCYIGLIGYLVARLRGARFVFDMYDRYDLFAGYRRLLGFDPQTFLLRHADIVCFASASVLEKYRGLTRNACLVPNGIDTTRFQPVSMSVSRQQFQLPESKTLVGYFGSMEPDRGVSDLIAAVGRLVDDGVDANLVIAGTANPEISLDHPWVHYLGNLDFAQMPAALSSCDILALPYRQSEFMDSGASCKIAEYIAVGRPVFATRTSNLVANFPEQASELDDLLAKPGDVEDIRRCLRAQIAERRVASMPGNMEWRSISEGLLESLEAERTPKKAGRGGG
ncbi:MAG: glycosyltransferase family 4 protein [Woeseiaceae bacterium]|nr:glycosyltransferase family 4 protein [Woeseiaceae bacterium]